MSKKRNHKFTSSVAGILTAACMVSPAFSTVALGATDPLTVPHITDPSLTHPLGDIPAILNQTNIASGGGKATLGYGMGYTQGHLTATETVTQTTPTAVINWSSFSVGKNAEIDFIKGYSSGNNMLTLSRVTGNSVSEIYGAIKDTNGTLILVNRNGINFENGSHVNVAGLIASTSDICANPSSSGCTGHNGADATFVNSGKYTIASPAQSGASITNDGTIETAGLAALVAPQVTNASDGTITAHVVTMVASNKVTNNGEINATNGGTVTLAAPHVTNASVPGVKNSGTINAPGGKVTLEAVDLYGDGLINMTANGTAVGQSIVENSGAINATGGHVVMTAADASSILNNQINMSGTVQADSVEIQGGKIVLASGSKINASGATGGGVAVTGNDVTVAGDLEANGTNGKGGDVSVTGNDVAVSGDIEANGTKQGGNVSITGNGHNSTVSVTGTINADGEAAKRKTATGGQVNISGDQVTIGSSAVVSASGTSGGSIDVTDKDSIDVQNGAKLYANGTSGKGGSVTVDGGDVTVGGDIEANGATQGGTVSVTGDDLDFSGNIQAEGAQGGKVTTTGTDRLIVTGFVDASGTSADTDGLWNINSDSVTIEDAPTCGRKGCSPFVSADSVGSALSHGTNVTVTTASGDIDVASNITKTGGAETTLTLDAAKDANVEGAAISANDANNELNVSLNANKKVELTQGTSIDSNGGDVTLNGGAVDVEGSTINSGDGDITISGTGYNSPHGSMTVMGFGSPSFGGSDVKIGNSTISSTGNGKITVSGNGAVDVDGTLIDSEDGKISISGKDAIDVEYSTIKSSGGDIMIANTGDDSYRGAMTDTRHGSPRIGGSTIKITESFVGTTGKGKIAVSGNGAVDVDSSTIKSKDGKISITGNDAIDVENSVIKSRGGDIMIANTGDDSYRGAMTDTRHGSPRIGGSNIKIDHSFVGTTGKGTITVSGSGAIDVEYSTIKSRGGDIVIANTEDDSYHGTKASMDFVSPSFGNSNIKIAESFVGTTGKGKITVSGNGAVDVDSSTIKSKDGKISITGNDGIDVENSTIKSRGGDIVIANTEDDKHHGTKAGMDFVSPGFGGSNIKIDDSFVGTTGKGTITVSGNSAIDVDNSTIKSKDGKISITGNDAIDVDSSAIESKGGDITITGTGYDSYPSAMSDMVFGVPGFGSSDIVIDNSTVSTTGKGKITIFANGTVDVDSSTIKSKDGKITLFGNGAIDIDGSTINSRDGNIVIANAGYGRPYSAMTSMSFVSPYIGGSDIKIDNSTISTTGKGTITVSSSGDIRLGNGTSISSTASGAAITLAASNGDFINYAGANAVITSDPNGYWLIYSNDPTTDVFGGLNSHNRAIWGTSYPTPVSVTGDHYIFAGAPKLTITVYPLAKLFGTDGASLVASDYTLGGTAAGVAGAYLSDDIVVVETSDGSPIPAKVGDYGIFATATDYSYGATPLLSATGTNILTVTNNQALVNETNATLERALAQASKHNPNFTLLAMETGGRAPTGYLPNLAPAAGGEESFYPNLSPGAGGTSVTPLIECNDTTPCGMNQ
ncbi:MAG: filamentous hemagglutinin N-terminal domain-containing protein [Alphaproteobacteria bacterium]|nr:filamentous hemagglutinin N-terminal domain-containing protein [Alphaproteobacteria bacterium]